VINFEKFIRCLSGGNTMKRNAILSSIVISFCLVGTLAAEQEREASPTKSTEQTTPVISETEMKAVQGQNSEGATQKATQGTGDLYGKGHEQPVANKPSTDIERDQEKKEEPKAQTGEGPPKAVGPAQEGTEKALKADEKGPEKGGGALKPEKPKAGVTARPLDRRWITKQQEQMKARPPVKAPSSLPWKNENQKARCEAYLGQMRENFLKARYHSIQGDSCNTAGYSRAFLSLVEICKRECPEGFLERSGYTTRIIRNLNSLEELGTKRCVGGKKTGSN
jgi:hypothetical protein